MAELIALTLEEKIDRAKDGRTQTWIVGKLNDLLPDGEKITEVNFSRKKKGFEQFTQAELSALSKVLPSFEA